MNNLKIHEKQKIKKKPTCAWRVTTKTCLESEYIKNIKTIYLSISMYMGPPPPIYTPTATTTTATTTGTGTYYYCYYYRHLSVITRLPKLI